jgi:hypothetical protein
VHMGAQPNLVIVRAFEALVLGAETHSDAGFAGAEMSSRTS